MVFVLVLLLVSCGTVTPYEAFRKENKQDVALSFGASRFVLNRFIRDKEFRKFTKQSGVKKYHILVAKENPKFLKSNFAGFLVKNKYEEIFHTNTSDGKIYIYSCEKGDKLKEVIVKLEEDSQIIFLSFQGDLKINDFEKLTAFNEVN